jgi:hypothetical protein
MILRLRHRVVQKRSQSHPPHVAGWLTVPQLARALDLSPHWLYDRIHNGRIQSTKNAQTGLFLFPDVPSTPERLRLLNEGALDHVALGEEYQHA